MPRDVDIRITISTRATRQFPDGKEQEQIREITYAMNEACSKLEELGCDVYYNLLVGGKSWSKD